MEDPSKIELRQWTTFDQTCVKDFFRDQSSTKLAEIMAERNAAIVERDAALLEKRNAYAERDAALMQRDMAYADRDAAWNERDNALAALSMLQANESNPEYAAKLLQIVNFAVNRVSTGSSLLALPPPVNGMVNTGTETKQLQKQKKRNTRKTEKETSRKRKVAGVTNQLKNKLCKPLRRKRKQQTHQDGLIISKSKSIAPYDLSSTPVPFCSCTGNNQQCYRWGSGGWQSACCTNLLSVYPLPVNQARRGARVAGRKMSGGAFKKLLERLSGAGVDITKPVDLKHHWAKHGTNRYVTIK